MTDIPVDIIRRLERVIGDAMRRRAPVIVMTGAGISAESGIPTFRGPEGYWTVGSRSYHPQEMATYRMFQRCPAEVWRWYQHRLSVCRSATPNAAHRAVVDMDSLLENRFTLITQNVDNLHLRAGSHPQRTFQIHGNIEWMRCAAACTDERFPVPPTADRAIGEFPPRCPLCGGITRPHVLWFDETYDETHYHYESALAAARRCGLLLVAGTSGATTLPLMVAAAAADRGARIVDVNVAANPFSQIAGQSPDGVAVQAAATVALPLIVNMMRQRR